MADQDPQPERLGIDVGGTFTDFLAYHPARGWRQLKRATSRPDPSLGIFEGLEQLGLSAGTPVLSHGTTAGTNVVLERRGPRVALVTTAGFRDILQLGRGQRLELYSMHPPPRPSLVPPELCFEVEERIDAQGQVLLPLRIGDLAQQLQEAGAEAVAICLLFAYLNPSHELALQAALDLPCTLSHRVDPQPKEYERASTTVLQAYLRPSLERYIQSLEQRTQLWMVRSSGRVATPQEALDKSVGLLLSGPAAGLSAAWELARGQGISQLMTLDVGGTSSDVALCDGELPYLEESEISGLPFRCPQVEIHTIGAGGGSIAEVVAGVLEVGPRSAGSHPGPAAYGRGGPATVSDALLALGRLPEQLAGGQLQLHPEASQQALQKLADQLQLPLLEVAAAIVALAEQHMALALRLVSLERGHDPRRFTLMGYGGAGANHAACLAQQLGMSRVIIPAHPGLLCAQGALLAPWQSELSRSWARPWTNCQADWQAWRIQARRALREQAPLKTRLSWSETLQVRYLGQGSGLWIRAGANLERRFARLHQRRYGYTREHPLELISSLVSVSQERPLPQEEQRPLSAYQELPPLTVWHGLPPQPLQTRHFLGYPEDWIEGPARLDGSDGTVWIPPNWRARRLLDGALCMESLLPEEEHEE